MSEISCSFVEEETKRKEKKSNRTGIPKQGNRKK